MGKCPLCLALALVLASGCVHVQLPKAHIISGDTQAGLTWNRAVDLALAHHPDVRQAQQTLTAKAHVRNQALGSYLQTVDGTLTRKHSKVSSTTTDSLALDLDVEQPLFTGFKTTGEAI